MFSYRKEIVSLRGFCHENGIWDCFRCWGCFRELQWLFLCSLPAPGPRVLFPPFCNKTTHSLQSSGAKPPITLTTVTSIKQPAAVPVILTQLFTFKIKDSVRTPSINPYFWFWSSIFLGDLYCTSSLAILMLSVTSENTVGFINRPLSSMARPPHSSLAPSFFPLSISSRILSNCSWSICQTQKEKEQTAAPLLSWFQRGVMECGPGHVCRALSNWVSLQLSSGCGSQAVSREKDRTGA